MKRSVLAEKPILTAGLGSALLLFTLLLSMAYGTKPIPLSTMRDALLRFDPDNIDHLIVITSRLPRAAGAMLIGCFLAVSGALMQGMTRNPLASPSIMGVSDGSVFAVTAGIVLLPGASSWTLIGLSLAGSALGAALVFGMARFIPGGASPVGLAILGTVMGTLLGGVSQALSTYFQVSQNISFWYNARLNQMDPALIGFALPFAAAGLALALAMARPVAALALGDDAAAGLGLPLTLVKGLTMLAVVILTGVAVALAGKIAFVGLIVPHVTRFLVGPDYRKIVPFAGLFGALFLAWCDLISRFLNYPFETPVGVVTALFGVPYFLYLIRRRGGAKP
jgi:iron complex transport system permease protein